MLHSVPHPAIEAVEDATPVAAIEHDVAAIPDVALAEAPAGAAPAAAAEAATPQAAATEPASGGDVHQGEASE